MCDALRDGGLRTALRGLEQSSDRVVAEFSEASSKEAKDVEKGVYSGGKVPNGTANTPRLNTNDGEDELQVQALYVVGCDGANSTVRHMEKFSVTTLNFENDWLILDLVR